MASAMFCPCETRTSTCRNFATISSGLWCFLGILVLLDAKRHTSGRTTSKGEDHKGKRWDVLTRGKVASVAPVQVVFDEVRERRNGAVAIWAVEIVGKRQNKDAA